MNFRIFKLKNKKEVLVYRGYSECQNYNQVTFEAWYINNNKPKCNSDDSEIRYYESIQFPNESSAKNFIKNLNIETVEEFYKRFYTHD